MQSRYSFASNAAVNTWPISRDFPSQLATFISEVDAEVDRRYGRSPKYLWGLIGHQVNTITHPEISPNPPH